MDVCEVNQKLHYVIELLGDLWHYHQAGAHACSCSVCTKKQSLARSIIAKALQEVVVIANCFESNTSSDIKNTQPSLNNATSFSCGTLPREQDVENAVLKDSTYKTQGNTGGEINYSCSTQCNSNRNERKSSSVSNDSLRDSGLNTSLSSQSVSSVRRCQHRSGDNTQLQISDLLNEISNCDVVNLTQSPQDTSRADTSSSSNRSNRLMPGSHCLSNVQANRSSHLPTRRIFMCEDVSSEITDKQIVSVDSLKVQTSNFSPSSQAGSSKRHTSNFSPSNQAGSSKRHTSNLSPSNQARPSFASQGVMFLSFPLVTSPPAFVDKIEDCCRHSEQMLSHLNAGCENTTSNMNQPCSHQLHVTQIVPVLSIHSSASAQADNPLVNSEEGTASEEESKITNAILETSGFRRGSLHQHLSMQEAQLQNSVKEKTNCPLQDEHSLRSHAGDGCMLDVDKSSSHCHQESHTQQLHFTKSRAACNSKSKLDSSSTETISCSLSTLSLKEEEQIYQSSSACYKNEVIVDSHHHHHHLILNTTCIDNCVLDVDTPSSHNHKESHTEQQLECTKPHAGSNEKHKLDSSSTETISCSLSAVSLKEEEQLSMSSSACDKNDANVDSCHHHQLFPNAAGKDDCACYQSFVCARELCKTTNCQDDSHFVWRPWQAKDMIVGLINSDSDEDKQTSHDTGNAATATSVCLNKHVPNGIDAEVLDSARRYESANSTHVRTRDSDTNTVLIQDTYGSEQQRLLSSRENRTEHTYQTLKVNSKRNVSEIPISCMSLPSGNGKSKHRSQDNLRVVAADINVGMVHSEKSLDVANIKIIDEHKSVDVATDAMTEQPSSMDRSLKCLSNIVHSPKNNKSDIYKMSTTSPEVLSRSLSIGKENSDMGLQKPVSKPALRKMSTDKPVNHEKLASLHEIFPTGTSINSRKLSDVKTQLGTASALDLSVSGEHVSHLHRNTGTHEVGMPVSLVQFTQSECSTVKQGVDLPVLHVRFAQSECYNVKHDIDKNCKLSLSISPNLTAKDHSSRPVTSKAISQIPWGAPAVMVEPNLHMEHELLEKPPNADQAAKCTASSNTPVTRQCDLKGHLSDEHSTSEVTSKLASSNHVTFITDRRDKVVKTNGSLKSTFKETLAIKPDLDLSDKYCTSELTLSPDHKDTLIRDTNDELTKTNGSSKTTWGETPAIKPNLSDKHCTSEMTSSSHDNHDTITRDTREELTKTNGLSKSTWKETTAMKTSGNNLNQTLPARKTQEKRQSNVHKMINESYEANQSFPKTTKSQQSVPAVRGDHGTAAVCAHGMVTGIHQLSSEWPSKPVPRNRRSVFGFSPPDHLSPEFSKPDANFNGQVEITRQNRKSSSGDESGLGDVWSLLDVSDDIGQIPAIQEVLFNCVTSSLCIVDSERNGKILSLNESFQLLIGVHEKVVGQKLFRFIKFGDFDLLGQSLPQSFVLADGRITSITGKLAHCVNASGAAVPVQVWTVPFKPQPKFTVCVIGVSLILQADVYLSGNGQVLMYSQPFEDIVGSAKEGEKATYRIPDVDYSQSGRPQHITLETRDGCYVPVMLTLINDPSVDAEIQQKTRKTDIYPAVLSLAMNLSGLVVAGSDGVIKFWDKNYFRINLGHCHLEDTLQVSDILSEIMRVSSSSTASSADSSPVLECKLNTTVSNLALADISYLQNGDTASEEDRNIPASEFYLPQSCFSSQGLVDLDDSVTGESDDDDRCNSSVMEESEGQDYLQLPASSAPYQTSTPCKGSGPSKHGEQKDILMEKGTYVGYFLHGDGSHIPVTFKLSHLQTNGETLFCLWVCIMPGESKDNSDARSNDSENDEDESEVARTSDEEELGNHLRNLHLKHQDTSLGQMMMMDQAGFNQSHNATSDADLLDLEVAVGGSFGNKYAVCEALGQGSFGFVRRAKVLGSASTVVVKFIKKSHMFEDSWINNENSGQKIPLEVAILRETYNEHIIKLLDFHENDSFVQMVMEDFGETDLFDFIDQVEIDEPLACHLFRQILWAVDYLHSKNIIHRDIKDENVIVSRSFHCKLIDFGSAAYMLPDGEMFTKFRGTLEYCSPEVHNGDKYRGPELDVWALGITLYTILFRENPFTATEVPGTLTDLPHPVTEDAVLLLLGLLQPDPLKRFTILRALACDWLRQIVDLNNYSWCDLFGDVPTHSESMFELDY